MTNAIQLLQLKCVHCNQPLSASEEEIAWACPQCGKGTQLTDDGLAAVTVSWCVVRSGVAKVQWFPFWVLRGQVNFKRRETFSGNEKPNPLWNKPVYFYIPAFTASVDQIETLGAALTKAQPNLKPGTADAPLVDCTLFPSDAAITAEFVVLTIEAERRDMLQAVDFVIENQTSPELWLLPFSGSPSISTLVI